jgi:hypothetical protein
VALSVVAAVLVAAALPALDAVSALRTLQRGVALLERAAGDVQDPLAASGGSRLDAADAAERQASADIGSATASLRANPALALSGALAPPAGMQRTAALDMARSAGDAAAAVGDLVEVGRQAARLRTGAQAGAGAVRLLVAAEPALRDAEAHLDAALARLRRDSGTGLLPPLASRLDAAIARLEPALVGVSAAAGAAAELPALLGAGGPRTYLLLFPNPYELRPAGGLVGTLATMTIEGGTVTAFGVRPYSEINSLQRVGYPIPAALARRMSFSGDSMDIGDAGWDPDFPSTAELSERMLLTATGQRVDGTISIDPYAIAALLRVTGPIQVPPYGELGAADFFARLNAIVNVDHGPDTGQQAVGAVAGVLFARLVAAPPSLWLRLLAALGPEALGGHVMLSLHDPEASAAARAARLDGSLVQPPEGEDYELVADANVGGNKADAIVVRSVAERVEEDATGLARHELVLRYEYPPGLVDPTVPAGGDPAYRDYVRVYLPVESTLTGVSGTVQGQPVEPAIEDLTLEHGKRVVGTFLRVQPGQTVELRLLFETPLAPGRRYRLYVQKQAGIAGRPLALLVSVPGAVRSRALDGRTDQEVTVAW